MFLIFLLQPLSLVRLCNCVDFSSFILFTSKQNFSCFYCNLNIIFIHNFTLASKKTVFHVHRRKIHIFEFRILFLKCSSFSKINHIHVFDRNTCFSFFCPHIYILTRKVHRPCFQEMFSFLNFDISIFKSSPAPCWPFYPKEFFTSCPKKFFSSFWRIFCDFQKSFTQTRIFHCIHCFLIWGKM